MLNKLIRGMFLKTAIADSTKGLDVEWKMVIAKQLLDKIFRKRFKKEEIAEYMYMNGIIDSDDLSSKRMMEWIVN